MRLTKIVIDDYNSIKDPQTIDINGEIVTFLGKNGSGKSNLLRALRLFFNPAEFLGYQREASYHAFLELNEQEVKKINKGLVYNRENRVVEIAFTLDEINQKHLISPAIHQTIEHLVSKLHLIYKEVQVELQLYVEELGKQQTSKTADNPTLAANMHVFQKNKMAAIQNNLQQDLQTINNFLQQHVKKETLLFKSDCLMSLDTNHYGDTIKLSYDQLYPKTKVKKQNEQDEQNLKKDIKRFNSFFKKHINKIDNQLSYFVFLLQQLSYLFYKEVTQNYLVGTHTQKEGLLNEIQKTMQKRCFYLDNEQGLMFKHQINKDLTYQGFKPRQNMIMESFSQYCIEQNIMGCGQEIVDLTNCTDSRKEELKRYFTNFINEAIPRFDAEMLDTIHVEIEDDRFKLLVVEKSGDRIDFDDTSLGRRWYFTYLFIKKILKRGDVFIIDEPASFLHPEAQKTILRELEELAKNGVIIFISTHSPYMISHNYSRIYFVSMTTRGTIVEKAENQNYALLKDIIGEIGFSNLLLNLTKKYIIVEGPSDLACIKAFIRIFDLDESQYEVWYLEGAYNIRRIKRFLENNHVNSVQLLDYDMRKNYNYEPDDIFFVGEGTKEKSIEGLFHPKDKQRYFKRGKLAHEKIIHATKETVEKKTYDNFYTLFKEMGIIE